MPKVLEAYMGEAAWPAKPTWAQTPRPPWALAQRGGIIAGYCSDAPAMQWSTYD